jgi:hypothetical protein
MPCANGSTSISGCHLIKCWTLTIPHLTIPLLAQASAKQLNDKSAKAKAGALLLLQQLVAVQSDSMQSQISLLLPALIAILNVRTLLEDLLHTIACPLQACAVTRVD